MAEDLIVVDPVVPVKKKRGRPAGFKLTEAQKEAMRLGRERARAARSDSESVKTSSVLASLEG